MNENRYKDEGQKREENGICYVDKKELIEIGKGGTEEEKAKNTRRRTCVAGVSAALILAAVILGVFALCLTRKAIISKNESARVTVVATGENGGETDEIIDRCFASSVSVRLGAKGEYGSRGASGFIVSSDGWIVSGAEPLSKGGQGRLYVITNDEKEFAVEKLKYSDDGKIVMLKISASGAKLQPVEFEEAENIKVGERLYAVSTCGSPDYAKALSVGIVSNPCRTVWLDGGIKEEGLLQTDMTFSESDVGCPVFNAKGKLVGVSAYGDTNFLLSAEKIKKIMEETD